MTTFKDELNDILMCLEKHVWKELAETYPVTNQKAMTRAEVKQAIIELVDREIIGEDEEEADGWDVLERHDIADCCVGDQVADARNSLKYEQRVKLGVKNNE